MCTPFDPKLVDKFDIANVPTLTSVIADLSKGSKQGSVPSLEPCFNVFKEFLKKCKVEVVEEIRQVRELSGKSFDLITLIIEKSNNW